MNIHQFVHTLSYGDAISGEALAIRRMLRAEGHESQIYCLHAHEKLKAYGRSWNHYLEDLEHSERSGVGSAVVMHYSIGSPLNALFTERTVRALIYHNLTPERWFLGYNPRVVGDLQQGRIELPSLLTGVEVVLADSEFNRRELHGFGCESAEVLPLFIDTEKWSVPANAGIARAVRGHGGKNIVHVGRLAPNKCIEDIIKSFYFYHHKIEERSKLWLVGMDIDTEIYSFELRRLISELRLQEAVEFVGTVADSELRAIYEGADLYLCMSEHEGFCVPLVEAMYFNVPVVAFDSTAVGGTLGSGGILLGRKSPAETAELMHLVISDPAVAAAMRTAGAERVREFAPEVFLANLRQRLIEPLIAAAVRRGAATGDRADLRRGAALAS